MKEGVVDAEEDGDGDMGEGEFSEDAKVLGDCRSCRS
jgi:hypothetical protein